MIRHVVFYSYRPDVPESEIKKIYEELDQVSARLPGRLSPTWGKYDGYDNGHKNYTHCLVVDFKDEAARELFMTDPAGRPLDSMKKGGGTGRPYKKHPEILCCR